MTRSALAIIAVVVALLAMCVPGWCVRLEGVVTDVDSKSVTASFPAAVKPGSIMLVLSGNGESIAGMAISQTCEGSGPYEVSGYISWVNDHANFASGKTVYVNAYNAYAIPTRVARRAAPAPAVPYHDLGFYYYSAAQRVGYGALGLGLERSLRLGDGLALELDAGITGFGSLEDKDGTGTSVTTNNLVETLNGKVKMSLVPGFDAYAGYRWNKGKGKDSDSKWLQLVDDVSGKSFYSTSEAEAGTVILQGIEYGLTFGSGSNTSLSIGYVPQLRTDYGGLGIIDQPAYSAEIRWAGSNRGGVRLRGISTKDYWMADLGITIR